MKKWSRANLDDYILLPAMPGYVLRTHCFFISHVWLTPDHPDPNGEYLRLHQAELGSQTWSYVWADWTCLPQIPRSFPEQAYFNRCLRTIPGIIRNSGFSYFYPPFEPRLWVLYEITEYVFTCDKGITVTPDNETYLQHVKEMCKRGVQATLVKYGYRCSEERDRAYLVPWLELLVLFRQLKFDIGNVRIILDQAVQLNVSGRQFYPGAELDRHRGLLVVDGKTYTFTPFPRSGE